MPTIETKPCLRAEKPCVRPGDRVIVHALHFCISPGITYVADYEGNGKITMVFDETWGWVVKAALEKNRPAGCGFWVSTDPLYSTLPDSFLAKCERALQE